MRVDPDSPLAEDLKKLKEKEGKDHILMSFMFKVNHIFVCIQAFLSQKFNRIIYD